MHKLLHRQGASFFEEQTHTEFHSFHLQRFVNAVGDEVQAKRSGTAAVQSIHHRRRSVILLLASLFVTLENTHAHLVLNHRAECLDDPRRGGGHSGIQSLLSIYNRNILTDVRHQLANQRLVAHITLHRITDIRQSLEDTDEAHILVVRFVLNVMIKRQLSHELLVLCNEPALRLLATLFGWRSAATALGRGVFLATGAVALFGIIVGLNIPVAGGGDQGLARGRRRLHRRARLATARRVWTTHRHRPRHARHYRSVNLRRHTLLERLQRRLQQSLHLLRQNR
mmetsp:Transcript_54851/g.95908  ORF Transcript_54851/g.95908 Transcript_54851/m.95908 type:complete len:283 (+) Transcript_54851:1573-2421(+)